MIGAKLRTHWRLPAPSRKDASMDILWEISRTAVDPAYADAARGRPRRAAPRAGRRTRRRWGVGVVVLVTAMLVAVSAVQSLRAAPLVAEQRQQLIDQVEDANATVEDQRAQVADLQDKIAARRAELLSGDEVAQELQARVDALAVRAGGTAMTGPGLTVITDDAATARADGLDRVLDSDLQLLVNGLWRSGAEAVAINGQRITSRSAIRSAGDAITVNYHSLSRPYTVTAIGPDEGFRQALLATPEGRFWSGLHAEHQIRFDVQTTRTVEVPADVSTVVRHARRAR